MLYRMAVVGGGLFLSISSAWGSGLLLMPIIGEWAALVAILTFAATVLIVDRAFPIKTPEPGQITVH